MGTPGTKSIGALAVCLLVAATPGCRHSTNKAGGASEQTVVLTLANHEPGSYEIEQWVAAVERLSGGSLRIELRNRWRDLDSDYEEDTVADLRAGKIDLAKIGARAWDLAGVTSFQALVAPLLVDSYELEQKALAPRLARRMLAGLDRLDLVGLAILPGKLRKPFGIRTVLKHPDDFHDARVGIRPGRVAELTLRALHALPVSYTPGSGSEVAALDAAELDTNTIIRYARGALGLTANVNLWPRAMTVAMNRRSFAALTDRQQAALVGAGPQVLVSMTSSVRADAKEEAESLCAGGLRFIQALPQDLVALHRAVRPVYAKLESDPLTAELIAEIRTLKRTAPAADAPTCARRKESAPAAVSELDGVYHSRVTREELLADPAYQFGEDNPSNYGDFRLELAHGKFELTGSADGIPTGGSFSVDGHRVSLEAEYPVDVAGLVFVYRWSRYRDTLSFTKVTGGPTVLVVHPWRSTAG
jgi:TRAP-type C4-dicarboxylate transport system substrate-binding protein